MSEMIADVIAIFAGTSVAAPLIVWLAGKWIGSRIDSSIKHEYDKRKIEYESELRRRERAQLVAELLAEWMSTPPDDAMSSDQRKRLNKLSFEATLWLPQEIAAELSQVLQHDPRAPNMFDLLLRVRSHLSGSHQLTVKNVTQWGREKEVPKLGVPAGFKNGRLQILEVVEEAAEQLRLIPEAELQEGYATIAGGTLHFQISREESFVKVSTPSIEFLQLVGKLASPGKPCVYIVETFPKEIANEINRNIFGVPESRTAEQVASSISPSTEA